MEGTHGGNCFKVGSSVTLSVGETTETRIKRIVFIVFQNKGVIHKETSETRARQ